MIEELCPLCGTTLSRGLDGLFCLRCYQHGRTEEEKAAQRAAAKRRRESPRALAGVDVDRVVEKLRGVPVLFEALGKRRIEVEVGHRAEGGCGGHARSFYVPDVDVSQIVNVERFRRKQRRARRYAGRVRVYGGPDTTPERVLEVVIHELCHLATPRCSHNERFRRVFARAVREAWGIEVPIDVERDGHQNASYKMGEIVVKKLRELIDAGMFDVEPYTNNEQRKVLKMSTTERAAFLVEKRAAHAVKMLKQSERRLKIAKTVHRRWAKKVSYYERQAAKRGQK